MEIFAAHTGTWVGANRFRLMPDDPPAELPATAQLTVGAGGRVAVLAYTWTHPDDGEQDGVLLLGPDENENEGEGEGGDAVLALWGDSWHQKPAVKSLRGTVTDGAVTVGYTYAEGWEWHITVSVDGPGLLRWRMDNVVPPSSAAGSVGALTYWAMQAELRRA